MNTYKKNFKNIEIQDAPTHKKNVRNLCDN